MGMTLLGQNFLRALMRAIWPISRLRSGGSQTEQATPRPKLPNQAGAPFVEGEERRGPSTAQPNHLTGSEMGRKSWVAPVGMTGFACGGNWSWELVVQFVVGISFGERSCQVEFCFSIKKIFLERFQRFSCFSRAIALRTS